MVPKKRKQRIWRVALLLFALLTAILLYFYVTSLFLHVETYTLPANVASPIRVVHLSDLHNAQFGKKNEQLVALVAMQNPDLIIISGDMLNSDDENTDVVTALISDLSTIAPVYYGYGNHEKLWEQRFGRDLRPIIESAGAVVVDNDYIDLEVHGTSLRIGGYMGFYPIPHMTSDDEIQQASELAFITDFQNTDRVKLLINHIPTGWVDWNYVNRNPVDFVFSGHYHGGIVRIPFLDRGLYAPYVGWFPPFTKGVYVGTKATCILSAGLGNEHHIPRFNNPPEIVVVDLIPIKEQ